MLMPWCGEYKSKGKKWSEADLKRQKEKGLGVVTLVAGAKEICDVRGLFNTGKSWGPSLEKGT